MSYHQKKKPRFTNRHNSKKQYLSVGQSGFLATCNFREKDCIRECYNLLNEYADELYGPEKQEPVEVETNEETEENSTKETDIADDLQRAIDEASTKTKKKAFAKKRFSVSDTEVTNCIFIRTTLENPIELGTRIIKDIAEKKLQKTRFLLRLIPIAAVCKANITDIKNAAGPLFDKYFLKESCSFSVVTNKRYNNDLDRQFICRELAQMIHDKNLHNRVDLKQPQQSVIVEIVKGLCCLSVVQGYFLYKKYNLAELSNVKQNKEDSNADHVHPAESKVLANSEKEGQEVVPKKKSDDLEVENVPAADRKENV